MLQSLYQAVTLVMLFSSALGISERAMADECQSGYARIAPEEGASVRDQNRRSRPGKSKGKELTAVEETLEGPMKRERDYARYRELLSWPNVYNLKKALSTLPQNSIWVDMGSGAATALHEALEAHPNIGKAVAIDYKFPKGTGIADEKILFDHGGRFEYRHGALVEKMYGEGKLDDLKGKVDLVTDVFGPGSYSKDLRDYLSVSLEMLKPGGEMVLALHRNTIFQPFSKNGRSLVPLQRFLKKSSGFDVLDVLDNNPDDEPIFNDWYYFVRLRRNNDPVNMAPLKTKSYDSGNTPPEREYYLPR